MEIQRIFDIKIVLDITICNAYVLMNTKRIKQQSRPKKTHVPSKTKKIDKVCKNAKKFLNKKIHSNTTVQIFDHDESEISKEDNKESIKKLLKHFFHEQIDQDYRDQNFTDFMNLWNHLITKESLKNIKSVLSKVIKVHDVPVLQQRKIAGFLKLISQIKSIKKGKILLFEYKKSSSSNLGIIIFTHDKVDQYEFVQISKHQGEILKARSKIDSQTLVSQYKTNSDLDSEILIEQFILQQTQKSLLAMLQLLRLKITEQIPSQMQQNPYSQILNQLHCKVILKTFKSAFNQDPIDYLNFHKHFQFREMQLKGNYCPIQNQQELKVYLSRRKPRKGKWDKFSIFTSCSACFGTHFEQINSFKSCHQCHYRTHILCCSFIDDRCDRCNYKRLSNEIKDRIPECFICKMQGFMTMKISTNLYVHLFCLISHNFWNIQDGLIKFAPSQRLQIYLHNKNLQQFEYRECIFCKQKSVSMLMINCWFCDKPMHTICGYFNGCSFDIQQHERNIFSKVFCCGEQKQRIGFDRKYKLNYKKIVFKKNGIGACNEG